MITIEHMHNTRKGTISADGRIRSNITWVKTSTVTVHPNFNVMVIFKYAPQGHRPHLSPFKLGHASQYNALYPMSSDGIEFVQASGY
jgi:hypothetical protein